MMAIHDEGTGAAKEQETETPRSRLKRRLVFSLGLIVGITIGGMFLAGSGVITLRPAPELSPAEKFEAQRLERIKAEFPANRDFFFKTLLPAMHDLARGNDVAEKFVSQFAAEYVPVQLSGEERAFGFPQGVGDISETQEKKFFIFIAPEEVQFAGMLGDGPGPFTFQERRATMTTNGKVAAPWILAEGIIFQLAYADRVRSLAVAGEDQAKAETIALAEIQLLTVDLLNAKFDSSLYRAADAVLADPAQVATLPGDKYKLPNLKGCGVVLPSLPGVGVSDGERKARVRILRSVFYLRQGKTREQKIAALLAMEEVKEVHFCCKHAHHEEE